MNSFLRTLSKPPASQGPGPARRVFVSMPADQWLTLAQNDLKWGIVEEIEKRGYLTEIFLDPRGRPGLAAGVSWSATGVDQVMRRCVGAAVLGFQRWALALDGSPMLLPTEFNHYEGAIAYTLGLPMLMFVQENVQRRVIFDGYYGKYLAGFPSDADASWLQSGPAQAAFSYWDNSLSQRRDIFLGYCGSSSGTARNLKRFLEADLKASVLDWRTDFPPADFILERIRDAAARCSAGIFLFTKDDQLADPAAGADKAVPRDNVVFEAGYFIQSKGKDRVLIVREAGAKVPADLGGDIYAPLVDRSDIGPVEQPVRDFVMRL